MSYNYQGQPGMPLPGQNPPHGSYPGQMQMPMPFPGQNPTQGSYPGQNQASMPMPEPYLSMPNIEMPQPGLCDPGFRNPSLPAYPQQPYPQANQAYPPPMSYPNQRNPSQYPSMNPSHISDDLKDPIVHRMEFYARKLSYAADCDLIKNLFLISDHEISVQDTHRKNFESYYSQGDTSGSFERLMVSLCCADRYESEHVDGNPAFIDVKKINEAGMKKIGTDESIFNAILVQQSYPQLKRIFQEFERISGYSINEAIKKEFSGDADEALFTIVKYVNERAEYFAKALNGIR